MRAVFALLVAVTVVVTAQQTRWIKGSFLTTFSARLKTFIISLSVLLMPLTLTIVKQVTDKMSETNTPENQTACDSVCTPLLSPYVTPLIAAPACHQVCKASLDLLEKTG